MTRLRPRAPSPALVVSIVALLVALGGTSYAAISLPSGSVGTKQLKDKAVTNGKLGPGSVGTAKIKDGSVTASKISTGLTVPNATNATNATTAGTANALASVQIVTGPNMSLPGVTPPGGPVPAGSGPGIPKGSSGVTCPQGKVAISGGEVNDSDQATNAITTLNQVKISGNSVTVIVQNPGPTTTTWHGYAVCVAGSSTGSSASG